ncbi:MAG: alkaline phosphatase D family protein [Cytophagales bacterium]
MKTFIYTFLISTFLSFSQSTFKISRTVANVSQLAFEPSLKPFYHGVASGDPLEDRVVIWTRVTPEVDKSISVKYEMSTDTLFNNIVSFGNLTTNSTKDYTVKVDVTGLSAYTTYYYRFITKDVTSVSDTSIVGRTKTTPLPSSNISNLKFAVVSCANYEGGFFNGYQNISKKNDLDAVIHLGDYIYEYKAGGYKNSSVSDTSRHNLPTNEILNEADYRIRYSLYRLDKDLMALHQQQTMISVWDDHETANDAYLYGAENHDSTEGDYQIRKSIAKKVYFEWMPIRDNSNEQVYRKISYGKLVDLIMLDTRLEGREKQPEHFDTPNDGKRVMISTTQYEWLINNLKNSTAKWKIIGNQTLFSTFNVGFAASNPTDLASIRATEDNFIDDWEGYLLQRDAIIDTLKKYKIKNTIFVTGDSHCSWSFDVTKQAVQYPVAAFMNIPQPNPYNSLTGEGYSSGKGSYAVEFAGPSISSANFDEYYPLSTVLGFEYAMNNPIPQLGNAVYNPHLKFVNLKNHGYFLLDIKSDSVQSDYYFSPTILSRNSENSVWSKGLSVKSDSNRITSSALLTQSAPKTIQDAPAPQKKQIVTSTTDVTESLILSVSPNPASDYIMINYALNTNSLVEVNITNIQGKKIKNLVSENQSNGVYQNDFDISEIPSGMYLLVIKTKNYTSIKKIIKN